jgi:hypothetical protein
MKTRSRSTGPSPEARELLAARSGGWCEIRLSGCTGAATEVAHRKGRKMGGRRGLMRDESNRLSNLIHACHTCHAWTHARPTEALDLGLMVREHDDPRWIPVAYQSGMWAHLLDDGTVWELVTDSPSGAS